MIDTGKFTREWIDAWNTQDLDAVLAHYTDDFEMSSPFISTIAGVPDGTLVGKQAVRRYWAAALERMPGLRFDHIATLDGVDSVVIHYRGPGGRLCAEVFMLDAQGKVRKAMAHYGAAPAP
jgi:hypothetical protein